MVHLRRFEKEAALARDLIGELVAEPGSINRHHRDVLEFVDKRADDFIRHRD